MPTPYQYLQLSVQFTSNSPVVDNPSFDLHYEVGGGSPILGDVTSLMAAVATALTTVTGSLTNPPLAYMSNCLSRTANMSRIVAYDIVDLTGKTIQDGGTPMGPPIATHAFTLPAAIGTGTQAMPEGICCAVTEQAAYGSDEEFLPGSRPRARDRGRFYFGPLVFATTQSESSTGRSIFTSTFMSDMTETVQVLMNAGSPGDVTYFLSVWSRKGAFMKVVAEASVDERPDYQRRRVDQGANRVFRAITS